MQKKIQSALISVFYKDGLEPLARKLQELGITIYSTGGTQKFLEDLGITCVPVESLTTYPSILGGRVKTLHPAVFGGILGRRYEAQDLAEMKEYKIPEIDLVIVDLYPFEETLRNTAEEKLIIEKIDIGGPSMIRAAAKNFRDIVVTAVRRDRFRIDGDVEDWIERRIDTHGAPAGALTLQTHSGAAFLVRDRATRDGGRATVFTDVTERERAERALAEQSAALEKTHKALQTSEFEARRQAKYLSDLTKRLGAAEAEADTAKTALLRTMSHELKTPLNAILGFSDLLRISADRFQSEQISEYAGLIHTAGGNLLKLINQILDLTKIAANRFPLRRRALPAGGAIWSCVDANTARATEKNITLEIADGEADLLFDADENALANMLGQLIDNAVNFTQTGGHIRVGAARHNKVVRFVVADNGPGVSADDLFRIQRPFEQAGRSMTDHTNGAGLGLPLAQGLAELHGGKLTIASVLGEGFTATLELPAA